MEDRLVHYAREKQGQIEALFHRAIGRLSEEGVDTSGVDVGEAVEKLHLKRPGDPGAYNEHIQACMKLIGALSQLDTSHPKVAEKVLNNLFTRKNVEEMIQHERSLFSRLTGREESVGSKFLVTGGTWITIEGFLRLLALFVTTSEGTVREIAVEGTEALMASSMRAGEELDRLTGLARSKIFYKLGLALDETGTGSGTGEKIQALVMSSASAAALGKTAESGSIIYNAVRFLGSRLTHPGSPSAIYGPVTNTSLEAIFNVTSTTVSTMLKENEEAIRTGSTYSRLAEFIGFAHGGVTSEVVKALNGVSRELTNLTKLLDMTRQTVEELEYYAWILMIFLIFLGIIWVMFKGIGCWRRRQAERFFREIDDPTGGDRIRGNGFET